jgi:hypothetical protein
MKNITFRNIGVALYHQFFVKDENILKKIHRKLKVTYDDGAMK